MNDVLLEYQKHNIDSPEQLYDYMSKNFDYGASVVIDGNKYLLPFGNENQNARNNKKIKFSDYKVSNFIYAYYNQNLNEINPNRISLKQNEMFELALTHIRNKFYKQNNYLSLFDNNIAGCNEEMEFAAKFLEEKGFEVKRLAFSSNKKGIITGTHWFLAYKDLQDKWFYLEHSLIEFSGIHQFNNFDELKDIVVSKMIYKKNSDPRIIVDANDYILNEIDPIPNNINWNDIINHTISGKKIDIINATTLRNKENELIKEAALGNIIVYDKSGQKIELDMNISNQILRIQKFMEKVNKNIFDLNYEDSPVLFNDEKKKR